MIMTTLFTWDTRGFNKKCKHNAVRSWIRGNNLLVGCLLVTRVKEDFADSIIEYMFCGWNYETIYEYH